MEWTVHDEQSLTWRKLKAYLHERITMHRQSLEAPGCSHDMAQLYRGQIFEDKKLLDLDGAEKP